MVFKIKGTLNYGDLASLIIYFKNTPRSVDTGLTDYKEILSLFVWFMDRNRPLPHGTAFDPYRESDEVRRLKEDKRRPMYLSRIKEIK